MRHLALAFVVVLLGCDKSTEVTVQLTGDPVAGEVELRVYRDNVDCPTLEAAFGPQFEPGLIPIRDYVTGTSPFGAASLRGLEAGGYTILAWSDSTGCVTRNLGCATIELPARGAFEIPMRAIDPVLFCGGACNDLPRCIGVPVDPDAGPACVDGCCGPDDTSNCSARGAAGRCVNGACLPFDCSEDGEPCAHTSATMPGRCCGLVCAAGGGGCEPPVGICEPPFEPDPNEEACGYLAALTPPRPGANPWPATVYGVLAWLRPDRRAFSYASGFAVWMMGDLGTEMSARFTIPEPDLSVQLCGGGVCDASPDVLRIALGATVLTDDPDGGRRYAWGDALFVWASRAASGSEVEAIASAEGIALSFGGASVPARLSLWDNTGIALQRLDLAPSELMRDCELNPSVPCDEQGPVPRP